MESVRYPFGDLDPEVYELRHSDLVPPNDLVIGKNYTLMYRSDVVAGHQYFSKYPVQVADIRMTEAGAEVELVHWEIRDESWPRGPNAMIMDKSGLFGVEEVGPDEEPFYDHGYLVDDEYPQPRG